MIAYALFSNFICHNKLDKRNNWIVVLNFRRLKAVKRSMMFDNFELVLISIYLLPVYERNDSYWTWT